MPHEDDCSIIGISWAFLGRPIGTCGGLVKLRGQCSRHIPVVIIAHEKRHADCKILEAELAFDALDVIHDVGHVMELLAGNNMQRLNHNIDIALIVKPGKRSQWIIY